MQNLDKITRDSYCNLRDATSNLKQKYHSRLELRRSRPKIDYNEFIDDDADDYVEELRKRNMAMVGLW